MLINSTTMKISIKITFLFLTICFAKNGFAQSKPKADSVFYLLDTAKTPGKDRMWDIQDEAYYKIYRLLCPCLKYGTNPVFIRRNDYEGALLNKNIDNVRLITLPDLITRAKEVTDGKIGSYIFFFIEPVKDQFILYKVALTSPVKSQIIHDPIYTPMPVKKDKGR